MSFGYRHWKLKKNVQFVRDVEDTETHEKQFTLGYNDSGEPKECSGEKITCQYCQTGGEGHCFAKELN